MMASKKSVLDTMRETANELHKASMLNEKIMQELGALCLSVDTRDKVDFSHEGPISHDRPELQ